MKVLSFLWLSGCTDYNLYGNQDKEEPLEPAPALQYSPAEIDLGVLCSAQETTVVLTNVGTAALRIEALAIDNSSWQLLEDPAPLELDPAESLSLSLLSGTDEGELIIRSNDPQQELSFVPLVATEDRPPVIEISTPFDGETITEEMIFEATVVDDVDPSETLLIQWTSDQDGIFSTDSAEASGRCTADWTSVHSPGQHDVQLTVSDSCMNTASSTVSICQQQAYEVENFAISTWHFEGVANWDEVNEWVELTPNVGNVVGSAFSTAQVVSGDQVEIEFLFFIGGGTGADGISLTALDTDRMTSFLGGAGCGIGYGGDALCTQGPALPGWSLEVDTFFNDGQDPFMEDHLMLTFDGDVDDPAIVVPLPEMEDNGWHEMNVQINAPAIRVAIDGTVYIDQAIQGYFAFPAYIGFTAGTGGQTNQHLIDSLLVTEQLCAE